METMIREEKWMLGILSVQVFLVCLGVLSRYVFGWSLSFTEEITRYLLVWLTCLGFPACWARGEMIQFRIPGKKPEWVERWLWRLRQGVVTLYIGIVMYSTMRMMEVQWRFHQKTSVMGWPIVWVSAGWLVFGGLMLYRMWGKEKPV